MRSLVDHRRSAQLTLYVKGCRVTTRLEEFLWIDLRVHVLADFVDPHRNDGNLTETMRHPGGLRSLDASGGA
jgi:hypothetical protein